MPEMSQSVQALIVLLVLTAVAAIYLLFFRTQQVGGTGNLALNLLLDYMCNLFYAFLGPACANFGLSGTTGAV